MREEEDGTGDRMQAKPARLSVLALEPLGVEELLAYIAELRAEIARAEAAVGAKQGHRSAAEAVFRK